MSKIVHVQKGVGIVAALKWSVLPRGRTTANIRKTASLVRAIRYTTITVDDVGYIGLETEDLLKKIKARKRYSLASMCQAYLQTVDVPDSFLPANLVGEVPDNAVFVLGVAGEEDKRAVVVIRNGAIEQDSIESRTRAIEIAQEKTAALNGLCLLFFEFDEINNALELTWESLLTLASSKNQLKSVPVNPLTLLAILGVISAIGLAAAYYYLVVIPEQEAQRRRLRAQTDKTPAYLKALKNHAATAAWDRALMKQAISNARKTPVLQAGWTIESIKCDLSHCTERWIRIGGTLDDLLSKKRQMEYLASQSKTTDEAIFRRKTPDLGYAVLDLDALPASEGEFHENLRPLIQKLDNAGIRMNVGKEIIFPSQPVTGIKKSALVMRRPLSMTASLGFSNELIAMTPPNVGFTGFTIKSVNKDFSISLEGNAYVR